MMTRLVRPRPGARVTIFGPGGRALLPEGDHVLAEKRGARRGPGHVHAFGVAPPDGLGHLGAADHGAEPELVPAGEEDAVHLIEHVQPLPVLAVGPALDRERLRLAYAQAAKQVLVAAAGIAQRGGSGDDRDAAAGAAAEAWRSAAGWRRRRSSPRRRPPE